MVEVIVHGEVEVRGVGWDEVNVQFPRYEVRSVVRQFCEDGHEEEVLKAVNDWRGMIADTPQT